jgi:hypothetical protein
MPRALKVFRTPTGFHDAYVAATSRKAALAAWGSDVDLFSRGIAEEVTDPELTSEPLAKPGEVIMRSRGDLADQLQALGPTKRGSTKGGKAKAAPKKAKAPSRVKLDAAEAAIAQAKERHAAELEKLEAERSKIEQRIEELRARHERALTPLERRRREAQRSYREALEAWSG